MFRIAICDDEGMFTRKVIEQYLRNKGVLYEISIFDSEEAFMRLGVRMMRYSAIFLGINRNGVNGLKLAKWIRQYSDEIFIVFITNHIDYSLEGYKFNAVRFLLKDRKTFSESMSECMNAILAKMNYIISKKDIKFTEGRKKIALNQILFIESCLHKLLFHIMEDQESVYTLYETLNHIEMEYRLYQFIRIHQSYLVNMNHIVNMKRYEVVLSNGIHLIVPKARYKYVEDAFIRYKGG